MAHYSEMDFLFSNNVNNKTISEQLNNSSVDNTVNILKNQHNTKSLPYVVYKSNNYGTQSIKNYIKEKIYDKDNIVQNPYIKLLNDFNIKAPNPGAGLKLKAADLAYLRDLGVYPVNRMAILRRFPEGCFVPENLDEMKIEPISTVVGWIKIDQNFGKIDFNETWGTVNERFDVLLVNIVKKAIGMEGSPMSILPIPDFAQGMLFEFYNKMGLVSRDSSVDETYDNYDPSSIAKTTGTGTGKANKNSSSWGLNKIPVGDPNVLHEGPFRDPEIQNIQSQFSFDLETVYEQKLLGDVDPGSAMLDILDNLYAMGTSNMAFYWGDASPIVTDARNAIDTGSLNAWWEFVSQIMKNFWKTMTSFFNGVVTSVSNTISELTNISTASGVTSTIEQSRLNLENQKKEILNDITSLLQTILTSTITIYRFKLRGSIELMTGGKFSSTPWYLTLGNPNSPWLATNHIIIKSASVETSTEMGFNDQPQRLTAKFSCQLSRSLGKQELMRMFNNTVRRSYSTPSTSSTVNYEQYTKTKTNKTIINGQNTNNSE